MRALITLLSGFVLVACGEQFDSREVQEGVIAHCPAMRNLNGDIISYIRALSVYADGDMLYAELTERQRQGQSTFPAIEVTFRHQPNDQYGRIQVDYLNLESGEVGMLDIDFARRITPLEVRVGNFILSPVSGQANNAGLRQPIAPPEIQLRLMRQYGYLMPEGIGEREARDFRFTSQGEGHFVGECEFYDDLSWVE